MNSRRRLLKACRCEPVDRPPVWIMRQAGRHLPEYRKLRETHSFHEVVQTPELALEVTMQPLRRYAVDAAIVFSDILVIPEAMGQPYGFPDGGGIEMDYPIETPADVDRLEVGRIDKKLDYVHQSMRLIRRELGDQRALIGFSGSPWTLATYMVEGKSTKTYTRAKQLFYQNRRLFDRLMRKITRAVVRYLRVQIDAGADVVQLFDSWGGVLTPNAFAEASASWTRRIIDALPEDVPVVVFSKNMSHLPELVSTTGADVVGVHWNTRLSEVKRRLPDDIAVQGNLDPVILNTTPAIVEDETTRILEDMRDVRGHVFNLGHGITPEADPENVNRLVDTVANFT